MVMVSGEMSALKRGGKLLRTKCGVWRDKMLLKVRETSVVCCRCLAPYAACSRFAYPVNRVPISGIIQCSIILGTRSFQKITAKKYPKNKCQNDGFVRHYGRFQKLPKRRTKPSSTKKRLLSN